MIYMGSKNRIAKYILPIILKDRKEGQWYVEPFVGGGNMIDKVDGNRLGNDNDNHVIQALIAIRDFSSELPENVSELQYKEIKNLEPSPINSWIRFVCSFGGRFNNGYARNNAGQNYARSGVNNAIKQSPKLQGVVLLNKSYLDLTLTKPCVIYCDPPYEGTTGYKDKFNHSEFWEWCRTMSRKGHQVFISEYNAPDDFECLWEGEIKTNFASQRKEATHKATEKLFKYKLP